MSENDNASSSRRAEARRSFYGLMLKKHPLIRALEKAGIIQYADSGNSIAAVKNRGGGAEFVEA